MRVSLPDWARDAPDARRYVSNATGTYEISCWDVERHRRRCRRPTGRTAPCTATLSADGTQLWWFDDEAGDEFGSWRRQPFGAGPGRSRRPPRAARRSRPDTPAGLEVGAIVVIAGFSDDDGTRVHLCRGGARARRSSTRTPRTRGVGALSTRRDDLGALALRAR